jgi:hypothetical protein
MRRSGREVTLLKMKMGTLYGWPEKLERGFVV